MAPAVMIPDTMNTVDVLVCVARYHQLQNESRRESLAPALAVEYALSLFGLVLEEDPQGVRAAAVAKLTRKVFGRGACGACEGRGRYWWAPQNNDTCATCNGTGVKRV